MSSARSQNNSIFEIDDNNIDELRQQFPNGLHFVVGDTHGQIEALIDLMEKIKFDSSKDHVYFVGDYNAGGNVRKLINYIAKYFVTDYSKPGFHLIRGNHERESILFPLFTLENLPDIFVIRGRNVNFFVAHAGMVEAAFDLITEDMINNPEERVFAYRIEDELACKDAPLRQIVWSKDGLYSRATNTGIWPSEESLIKNNALIIHGHTPYFFMKKGQRISYGDKNLFWKMQHICYSEDLRSFNIDSNAKGRFDTGATYAGLSCICLEVIDCIADSDRFLKTDSLRNATNFVFGTKCRKSPKMTYENMADNLLNATLSMKTIGLDEDGKIRIFD